MLTEKEYELLTRVAPGTVRGELLRRYWQRVALSQEIESGVQPVPERLSGEDLVPFREFADLRRQLWGAGYYAASVGDNVPTKIIKRHIRCQQQLTIRW